jgi:hypothetical protein
MTRLLGALAFATLVLTAGPASAKRDHEPRKEHRKAVPELSGAGAAAGLVLVGGAAAIVLGRRRARKS